MQQDCYDASPRPLPNWLPASPRPSARPASPVPVLGHPSRGITIREGAHGPDITLRISRDGDQGVVRTAGITNRHKLPDMAVPVGASSPSRSVGSAADDPGIICFHDRDVLQLDVVKLVRVGVAPMPPVPVHDEPAARPVGWGVAAHGPGIGGRHDIDAVEGCAVGLAEPTLHPPVVAVPVQEERLVVPAVEEVADGPERRRLTCRAPRSASPRLAAVPVAAPTWCRRSARSGPGACRRDSTSRPPRRRWRRLPRPGRGSGSCPRPRCPDAARQSRPSAAPEADRRSPRAE